MTTKRQIILGDNIMTTPTGNKITERTQADIIFEQAMLLDAALDPIILRDMDDKLIFWNKAAERLYGWTFEEAKSSGVQQLISGEYLAKYERGLKEFKEYGGCQIELHQKTKNGRNIITHSHWSLVLNKDGTPYARLIINRDITEQRNLETQLRRAQRKPKRWKRLGHWQVELPMI